jgi:hypothetical protein
MENLVRASTLTDCKMEQEKCGKSGRLCRLLKRLLHEMDLAFEDMHDQF